MVQCRTYFKRYYLMNDLQKIERLFELGHFANPEYPNNLNLKFKDLKKLTWTDKIVQDAFLSFEDIMGVPRNLMGDTGPQAQNLFEVPRCGMPDYTNLELLGKIGSGSWPEPCQKGGI